MKLEIKEDEKNYTDDTVARVTAFQKLNGKFVDGLAGEDTLKALYNTRGDSPNPMKLNDPKAPRGQAAYKILADLLGETYTQTDKTDKQALSNSEIQGIANDLIGASNGAGTAEGKVLMSIEKLKNKKDFQILDALIKKSKELMFRRPELKKIGLSLGSEYENLAAMINGEMGSDDIGTVKSIKNHLAKIGVNSDYKKGKDGEYIEDSFTIK